MVKRSFYPVRIAVSLSESDAVALETIAEQRGQPVAMQVREAIHFWLKQPAQVEDLVYATQERQA